MKFVKVKICCIPGFFSHSIVVFAEEKAPDAVIKAYAVSQTYGGNYNVDRMSMTIRKMKDKVFQERKTDIPEEFYKVAGETK